MRARHDFALGRVMTIRSKAGPLPYTYPKAEAIFCTADGEYLPGAFRTVLEALGVVVKAID